MEVLYKLNLTLGLMSWPLGRKHNDPWEILKEDDGAQRYRRNILALSGVVTVAALAGGDPQDLSPFGVQFSSGIRGVLALGLAVIGAQLYWYVQRYLDLRDAASLHPPFEQRSTGLRPGESFVRKGADLTANWAAFVLTLLSWAFIACWIAGSL